MVGNRAGLVVADDSAGAIDQFQIVLQAKRQPFLASIHCRRWSKLTPEAASLPHKKAYGAQCHCWFSARSLSVGLAAARVMFGPNFQPSESLKALVYFKNGDLKALSKTEKDTLTAAVSAVGDLPDVAILSTELRA